MSTTEETGKPARYQRSVAGLVVALATTVVVLGLLMWLMGLFRSDTDVKPTAIDYLSAVKDAQEGGLHPIYPTTLPDGYIATQAEVPDDYDGFEIDLLRGSGSDADFIGIRVADKAVIAQLVHEDVDKAATGAPAYVVPRSSHAIAPRWAGYQDSGGDTGYAATVGKRNVLVYGSAPATDLQAVVRSLSQAPLEPPKKGKR